MPAVAAALTLPSAFAVVWAVANNVGFGDPLGWTPRLTGALGALGEHSS